MQYTSQANFCQIAAGHTGPALQGTAVTRGGQSCPPLVFSYRICYNGTNSDSTPLWGWEVPLDRAQVQIPAEQLARQRDFETKIRDMHAQRPLRAMVDTFGCQQNVADSQHIMGMLEAMGCTFTDDPAQADVVVLNTCAIRDHAEKRVYGNLGALTHTKKANPQQVICLC